MPCAPTAGAVSVDAAPPAAPGLPATGWPLRRYLLALVLAVLLPVLTFAGVLLWYDVRREYDIHRRGMLDTVQALSLGVDREWATVRETLETLAASASIDTEDWGAFYDPCARVASRRPGAWTRSPLTGWSTILGVTEPNITGPIRRSLRFWVGGAVLALSLGLGLAWRVARRITTPLAALTQSATLVQRGQSFAMPPVAVREVRHLSAALVATAEAMRQQAAERERRLLAEAEAAERQRAAAAHGVTLTVDGVERLGPVAFHASTLRRTLLNLVQNAAEAMPQGGTVTLAGQGTAAQVYLEVRDTGSGIPAERLTQIFEPLHTTKPGGTGLGLYLVQEIVTVHGGQITVESVVGQGTTFTLTLPRATEAPAPDAACTPPAD